MYFYVNTAADSFEVSFVDNATILYFSKDVDRASILMSGDIVSTPDLNDSFLIVGNAGDRAIYPHIDGPGKPLYLISPKTYNSFLYRFRPDRIKLSVSGQNYYLHSDDFSPFRTQDENIWFIAGPLSKFIKR